MRFRPHPWPLPLMGGEWLRTAMAACFVFCFLTATAYNDYRNARVDSLEAALKSDNPPKGDDLLRAYDELMRGYLPFDSLKAIDYGRKAMALSYERNGLNVRQNVLRRFALLHYGREEFDEAIRIYQQALAVVDTMATLKRYTQKDIDDSRSTIYGNLGNVYNLQDKHHLAIHYYQLALPIFEQYNWLESQAILYYNIGELYHTMGNNGEALRNYLLGLEKGVASKDSMMMAMPRKGLTRLYIQQGDYAKARETANLCYAYYHAHRDEAMWDYAVVLASMVRLNLMDGHQDLAAAKTYAKEALALASDLDFEEQSDIYAAATELAIAERQWQQALAYGLRSIHPDSLATSADVGCYQLLAQIYTELGQKEKTREYISKMYNTMTRYATDHYQSGLSQMEVLYETEKKEAQIAALDNERGLYRWLLAAAIGLIVLLVLLFCLWWRSVRLKRKHALVNAKLEGELAERVRLSRDLHDRLGGLLTAVKLSLPTDSPAVPLTDEAITEMRNVSHHLLPESLRRNGLRTALRDYCQTQRKVTFSFVGDEQYIRHAETIYCTVYELVNNAIKSAQAQHIRVQLIAEKDYTAVNVSDDGNWIQTPPLTPPLDGREVAAPKGMGLQNIRDRVKALHGKMDINARPGEGTEINIELRNDD